MALNRARRENRGRGSSASEPALPYDPPGDWSPLSPGDERRFHPLYVTPHEGGLLLSFGRSFGDRAWERTKDAVKEAGARFARGLEGWVLPAREFALDRVSGLRVMVDEEAREAIEGARRTLRRSFEALPPAARHFRPSIRALEPDELRSHPALTEHERAFVIDVRTARLADLSAKQRDWLKRIEERHRARLDEDPALVLELFRARAMAAADASTGDAPKSERAAAPARKRPSTRPAATQEPKEQKEKRGTAGPTRSTAPPPQPESPPPAPDDEPAPVEESSELKLFQPQLDDLTRDFLRRHPIFRAEDRAELRRVILGQGSIWIAELEARLHAYLAAHPEARLDLFRTRAARLASQATEAERRDTLERAKDDDRFPLPRGFRRESLSSGDLHAYQRKGVRWLLAVRRGILAHDVGLGKTVQAIAAAAALMDSGEATRALVVVPKPRLVGWEREIQRFTDRSVVAVFGDRDERLRAYRAARKAAFVIVGYHALVREVPELTALGAQVLIVDEAHRLKSSKTLASQGFRELATAPYAFFLTATPMPNRPEELHALLGHLHPKLLGTLWGDFVPRYAIAERLRLKGRRRPVFHIKGYRNLDELRERISPYVFLKTAADPDVSLDLPPLREMVIELGLAPEQAELYAALRTDAAKTLAAIDPRRFGPRERASLLTHVLRLEQVVISPLLIDPSYRGASPKLDETVELVLERLERKAPGTIVFCRFLDALRGLRRALEHRGVEPALIASIEGSVPAATIDKIEQGFRGGRFRVLLASDAAREGLNLQGCADLLIHLDVPWVPNIVHQRNGRIHRQGQSRPVTVIHFRIPRTIEERKVATLERKRGWIAQVLGAGTGEIETALTLDDLRALLE